MTDYTTKDHYSQFNVLNWQPIETAPEDGTIVIIYEEGKAVSAFYDSSTKQWVETMDYYEVPDPTHWMPLPEPPSKT